MAEVSAGLFLTNYVYQIPLFLVWVIGGIVAIARWPRHPRPSLLLLISLTILFLRALVVPIITFAVAHSGAALARIGMTQGLISIGSMLVAAVAWSLLLVAVFGWRSKG